MDILAGISQLKIKTDGSLILVNFRKCCLTANAIYAEILYDLYISLY